MLVLTRKSGQRIFIGDDIVITMLGMRGNQYKIGIEAPVTVVVNREEIHEALKAAAAQQVRDGQA